MRVVRNLIAFLFFLVGAVTVAVTLALYLAATGRSVPVLRALASAAGRTFAGQQTTAASLAVHLQPEARQLSGTAQLTMRSSTPGRQRFYFLLNDGLRVLTAWQDAGGTHTPLGVLRLGPLIVVDLGTPLDENQEVRIGIEYSGEPSRGVAPGMVFEPDTVALTAADLWYPADGQGFFLANVEVLLPSDLTLVHNGREVSRTLEGAAARVRYTLDRPVPGLGLVAGKYTALEADRDGVRTRVLLPAETRLDAKRLLDLLAASQQTLAGHYGPSGFTQLSLFVERRLGRAFNDGTGLIGVPPRYFADGDYGFPVLAHEVAHNWWGATVSEQWLQPGTGGEWIVEGLAELSSWRAVRTQLGERAHLRILAQSFFDPDRTIALVTPSMIDNALDPDTRTTIYNKGAYVGYMLEQRLGSDGFDTAAKQFLEQFRYRAATAADVESVFASTSQQDLDPFFAAWVRGNESIDLALDPLETGGAGVRNHRTAPPPDQLDLWRFPPGSEPEKQTTTVGATTPIGNAERVVVDPLADVADMFRSNNVLPRHDNPRMVARSARGDLMIVTGEPYPWETAIIDVRAPSGAKTQSWVIDRGLLTDPVWSADGTRVLAIESPRGGQPTLFALSVTDGSRRTLGHDTVATGAADATLVARGSRLIRLSAGHTTVLADHPGARVVAPIAASDGSVAYGVLWDTQMLDVRVLPADGSGERVLFTTPAGGLRWRWAPDGVRIYAAIAAEWDWQLWELSLDGSAPRMLVREAALVRELAVAPDGNRVAFIAQAEIDDPLDRSEVFVIDRRGGEVRRFNLSGWNAFSVAWLDDASLALVVADPSYPSLPPDKQLRTLRLSDGSLEPLAIGG